VVTGLVTNESIVVPDKMLQGMGIHVIQDEVTRIDADSKTAYSASGDEFVYDKLFMATGSSSFIPPIEGNDLKGVMSLRGLGDADQIKSYLSTTKAKNIVFIGAGFISMEIASLLQETSPNSYNISVIELLDRPLPIMLDKDMGEAVREYLEPQGLTIKTGVKVEKYLVKMARSKKYSSVAVNYLKLIWFS